MKATSSMSGAEDRAGHTMTRAQGSCLLGIRLLRRRSLRPSIRGPEMCLLSCGVSVTEAAASKECTLGDYADLYPRSFFLDFIKLLFLVNYSSPFYLPM